MPCGGGALVSMWEIMLYVLPHFHLYFGAVEMAYCHKLTVLRRSIHRRRGRLTDDEDVKFFHQRECVGVNLV